ncbi:hypothetical protein QFC19_008559 [Naganishia cerealis]|uniref:Uncharacterized protein n=1 Tax=Naganishia cerealis TaxID=610337 RepID=A0ACC2V1R8_9TREE|nr:hypothetical protein QFC19_008559 [Naganishia cerealis]
MSRYLFVGNPSSSVDFDRALLEALSQPKTTLDLLYHSCFPKIILKAELCNMASLAHFDEYGMPSTERWNVHLSMRNARYEDSDIMRTLFEGVYYHSKSPRQSLPKCLSRCWDPPSITFVQPKVDTDDSPAGEAEDAADDGTYDDLGNEDNDDVDDDDEDDDDEDGDSDHISDIEYSDLCIPDHLFTIKSFVNLSLYFMVKEDEEDNACCRIMPVVWLSSSAFKIMHAPLQQVDANDSVLRILGEGMPSIIRLWVDTVCPKPRLELWEKTKTSF